MKLVLATLLTISSINVSFAAGSEKFYENSSGTPVLTLVGGAKTSLDIEIYTMDDPMFITAVSAAVDRGVKVRVVKEERPVGASCRVFAAKMDASNPSCNDQKALMAKIQAAGGEFVPFKRDSLCGVSSSCFEHGKMIVIDGKQALISTGNFDSSNICNKKEHPNNCDRDYSIVSKDAKVISTLTTIFQNDLKGGQYDVSVVLNQAGNQKLTVSPFSLDPLVSFIKSAHTKIQIETQYLKDPDMNHAIMDAAKSGIQVEVMVASACAFGRPKPNDVAKWQKTYGAFDTAGIQSRVFTRNIKVGGVAGYLHAKAIIVDGNRAWVGSTNGSTMSLTDNREYGIFLSDATEISNLQKFVGSDFADPAGETWQDSLTCKHDPAPSPQAGVDVVSVNEF